MAWCPLKVRALWCWSACQTHWPWAHGAGCDSWRGFLLERWARARAAGPVGRRSGTRTAHGLCPGGPEPGGHRPAGMPRHHAAPDATELRSMARVFAGCSNVPIGSLKSNRTPDHRRRSCRAHQGAGCHDARPKTAHFACGPAQRGFGRHAVSPAAPGRGLDGATTRGHQRVRIWGQQCPFDCRIAG